jgi:hypothetical protein
VQRRRFLASSLAASALAVETSSRSLFGAQSGGGRDRDYYELRRYHLTGGPQKKLTDAYLSEALIPGLNRLGIRPVGVFNVSIGLESPSVYVLIPCTSVEKLVTLDFQLEKDSDYMKAGDAFLKAPANEPAYVRMESSLMIAFEGRPHVAVPAATAKHGARLFELRTYESPSTFDHRRKVEMFHSGEFDIFKQAGFSPVFYGDSLIGSHLPNLTYMLAFESEDERSKLWNAFMSAPEWKKLTAEKRFNFESIVTNVTNQLLNPAPYSQI